MRDGMSYLAPKVGIVPTVQTNSSAAIVGEIIDRLGFESVTFIVITGTLTDADATFAVTLAESDDSGMSGSNAVAAADLIGADATNSALTNASFTFAGDKKAFMLGYKGTKRYLQMTVTPTNNDAGTAPIACAAIRHGANQRPTANPPT
ncbi:MAG: hypothetical protein U1E23_09525 [Reyranellaceae bacterium]